MLIEPIKFNTKFPPLELDSTCFGPILIGIVSILSLKFYSDVFIIEEPMHYIQEWTEKNFEAWNKAHLCKGVNYFRN